jgi:hypothetical protein
MGNDTECALSPQQCENLRLVAGLMLPASDEFAVPGADDPAIIADILHSLGRDAAGMRNALTQLAALACGPLAELATTQRASVIEAFLASDTPEVVTLGRVILQCYYRDDRVVRSLGLEPRPPFPKGHVLEQGDWSLLDAVRERPRMWRDVP